MTTVYVIPQGTSVAISFKGSDFQPSALPRQFQTDAPPELTDTHAIFTAGKRRIRVDRDDVVVARFDGQGGANEFGV